MLKSRVALVIDSALLGQLIREERIIKGMTQFELAKRLGGVTPQFISMVERGASVPSVATLERICAILDLCRDGLIEQMVANYREQLSQELKLKP